MLTRVRGLRLFPPVDDFSVFQAEQEQPGEPVVPAFGRHGGIDAVWQLSELVLEVLLEVVLIFEVVDAGAFDRVSRQLDGSDRLVLGFTPECAAVLPGGFLDSL